MITILNHQSLLLLVLAFMYSIDSSLISKSPSIEYPKDGKYSQDSGYSEDPQIYAQLFFVVQKKEDKILISQIQSLDGTKKQFLFEEVGLHVHVSNSDNNLTKFQQQKSKNQNDQISSNKSKENKNQQNKSRLNLISTNIITKNQSKEAKLYQKQAQNAKNEEQDLFKQKQIYEHEMPEQQMYSQMPTMQQIRASLQKQFMHAEVMEKPAPTIISQSFIYDQPTDVMVYDSDEIIFRGRPRKKIVSTQFINVGLYHEIPIEYVEGEVYRFYGIVTNSQLVSSQSIKRFDRINIVFIQKGGNNDFKCSQQSPKSLEFDISCKMTSPGRYFLSIFVGKYGKSSYRLRSILSSQNLILPSYVQPAFPEPKNLRIEVINNSLFVFWDSKSNLTNMTVYQKDSNGSIIKQQYLLSNNHQRFKLPFADFNQFKPTTTFIQISHASSMDGSLSIIYTKFGSKKATINFQAIDHAFDTIDNQAEMDPQIPWKINPKEKFKFNISFGVDIKNVIYIFEPDNKIRKLYFFQSDVKQQNSTIKAGSILTLQIFFSKNGTHIIQINNLGGLAVLNRPIYVGEGYPLIPDFKDLAPASFSTKSKIPFQKIYEEYFRRTTQNISIREPPRNSTIQQKQQYLLTLLNGLRKKFNVQPLVLDEQLNKIAKNHSDDMIVRNFFGHANPNGERAKDRAKKMNFTNLIGENIAQTTYLTEAHLGLERSAIHLQNSISRMWTRVGISVNISKSDQYIITYQFSTRDLKKNPITDEEQAKFKASLIKVIQQKNPNILREDVQMSQDIKTWMMGERLTQIFQFLINKRGYRQMTGLSFTLGYSDDWIEKMRESNILVGYTKFKTTAAGIGFKKNQQGTLQIFVVFA